MIRFLSVASRMWRGVNRVGVFELSLNGVPGLFSCFGVKYGIPGAGALYVGFAEGLVGGNEPMAATRRS